MKKILFPMLAAVALVAAPAAYAKTMHDYDQAGSWRVLADANTNTCFASNRPAASGEINVSGPYSSEARALAAIGTKVQCAVPEITG